MIELSSTVMSISILVAVLVGGGFGWLLARLKFQQHITKLETKISLEENTISQQQEMLKQTFSSLSSEALKSNNQMFIDLAQESLKRFHVQAKGDLDQKEKSIENLVKPIREALSKTELQIQSMEKERKEAYGSLHKHLETLSQTQLQLHDQTRNLVQALRRPEVRGQWGEITLRRLVELAGMVDRCDFFEQESVETENGRIRPDMIIRMPTGREIVVDVKTPLDAYLSAVESKTEDERKSFMEQHVRNVRDRIKELSTKGYWEQFSKSPDFAVLFIPGEQFLSSALDLDRELLEFALSKKIILATPTSMVALMRAIAFGWRQEQLTENAELIRSAGEELYKRLATFSEHLGKVGRSLDNSVSNYNKAVGSFDAKLIPGARKLVDLGISSGKEMEVPEQIEKAAREIASSEFVASDRMIDELENK